MPFITEELWHALEDAARPRKYDLIHAKWPVPKAAVDADAAAEVLWTQSLITQIRATKSDLGVAPGKTVTAFISKADPRQFEWLNRNLMVIKRMGRLDMIQVRTPHGFKELGLVIDDLEISGDLVAEVEGEGHVQLVADGILGHLDFFGIIDLDAERARIGKAIETAAKERDSLAGRLNNPAFVEKAKPEAVEKARADHAEKAAEAERLQAALARLG
jgi:valyl-tRNA synthetase